MGKNRNVIKLSMGTSSGTTVTGIYFGDVDAFLAYLEQKFGREEVLRLQRGISEKIQLSIVYFPKINSFRGLDELQFEIQYYQ